MEDKKNLNFNEKITEELLDPYNYLSSRTAINYRSNDLQLAEYKEMEDEDTEYSSYILRTYGSYENFYSQKKLIQPVQIYDPLVDFLIDVTIVKPDTVYKTDHISSYETIMENLTGTCTVWFVKIDGNTRKLTCTLEKSQIPNKENATRKHFFNPLPNNRIGVWDLNEQRWKSFYMNRVFKFVRDDSTTVE